ncbi:hypothetical protein IMAU80009_03275 [Lactiplantibacillus plantarum]|nr:hypothetical protein [Lactiplantibacillus plantarum]
MILEKGHYNQQTEWNEVNAHLHIEFILCCARPIKNLYQKSPLATTKSNQFTQNQFGSTCFLYLLDSSLNKLKSWLHLSDLVSA